MALAILVAFAMSVTTAQATVLYSEDFEGFSDGDIVGTDGWFTAGTNALNLGTAQ
ncbi:MAG: hypothetical protein GXP28_09225, partial [Planctomycetes bacterium]|nr:hypothetical protein [Planctomycetota bacterium]